MNIRYSENLEDKVTGNTNHLKNSEWYSDPTAFHAIRKIIKEDAESKKLNKLLHTIFNLCTVAGFTVEERIVLKDNKTKKIYK